MSKPGTGKHFVCCDTGGVIFTDNTDNPYQAKINEMIEQELGNAHKILLWLISIIQIYPEDLIIKNHLKQHLNKLLLVINKVDNFDRLNELYPFYSYGIEHTFPVSALHGNGIGDVLDDIVDHLSINDEDTEKNQINVALIGKPNAGKSSLYNAIFNKKKIVDHKMGTTKRYK